MSPRRARFGALARFMIGVVLLVGVLFLAVFPTRTYLDQRRAIGAVEKRLDVIRTENERMRGRIGELSDPSAIERIAREEYNLARPGEEVFVMIPSEMEAIRRQGTTEEAIATIRAAWGFE
ncbi:MAG TPA: septum formation initiator family protein [Acidimicrobiia bacterium]|nr:septum formation initiator family protein [Acidimicrobiia bacterium]